MRLIILIQIHVESVYFCDHNLFFEAVLYREHELLFETVHLERFGLTTIVTIECKTNESIDTYQLSELNKDY